MREHINTKAILKLFWEHIRPYSGRAAFILLLIVLAKVVDVIIPVFYKRFFDLLAGDVTSTTDLRTGLVGTVFIILILHLGAWVSWRVMALINNWFQPRVMTDLNASAHEYLHGHSYLFFSNNFAGSLVRKMNRIGHAFEKLMDQVQFSFVPVSVIIIGNLIVLWSRSALLGSVLLVWILFYLLFNLFFSRWKTKFDYRRSQLDSEAMGVLADSVTNAITIKLFTGLSHEKGLFHEILERWRRVNTFTWNLGEIMDASQALLMVVIEFVIMYFAIGLWQEGQLTVGDFALIQSYLIGFFMVLWDIGRSVRRTYEALSDADEIVEIMNTPYDVQDAHKAKELQVQTGRIEFQNVYFSFNQTRRVLRDMNFVIEPGEKVALVGPSGAGKSTITNLLFRFYDLERGKILIGNQNIAKVTQESLRANIALVPQEPILFHRSVMENIRYGRRDATDVEVIEAAKKAHAHEFIEGLQDGYNTYVGERGVKLSGGERQRVAIARAILKNAPILVLDEATSSLDSESEALIQEALEELMRGKTTIVIAHRLSTIMKMDRILVIDDGQVVDSGTHKQLLKKKENIYKKLWEIQAGGFIQ
ncbi:MAG TPA: ABC transporter ATP-binding protein [Patescibacteria group bacterium]|nr:ABC transporter ATP-binding protein [Patescibacteria group bacterium]